MDKDKEAILKIHITKFSNGQPCLTTKGVLAAMDEYSASLKKENEELKEQLKVYTDQTWYDEKYVEAKEKEIERLKGLIKEAKTGGCTCSNCEKSYEQFETENNL